MNWEDLKKRLIQEKEKELSLEAYIPFYGWNCHELDDNECKGWDMSSRRCECGNRRVSWIIDGCGKKDDELTVGDVYAEAY